MDAGAAQPLARSIPSCSAAPLVALTAPLLYRPITLPHHDLTWKTLAIPRFIVAVAWTSMLRGGTSERGQGASQWMS